MILGGQDGLVNILGIILGVIAGGGSRVVLLAAGFAAAFTESISMGAVGYTSAVAERDYYQAERDRETAEIDTTPAAERQEIRDIYAAKGFAGDLLDRVVDTITANRQSWLSTMMDEELHRAPPDEAVRGQLLRLMASDAIGAAIDRHLEYDSRSRTASPGRGLPLEWQPTCRRHCVEKIRLHIRL